jgi:hypothetical protein
VSDALDILARANPIPEAMRQEVEARALEIAPSWQTDSPPMGRGSHALNRRLAIVAIAALSLVVAGTALGLRGQWLDFMSAEPAPPKIVKMFAELDMGAPAGMATDVTAHDARRVPVPDNAGEMHSFWVAPTRPGGFCVDVADSGGGCDKLGVAPLGVTWQAQNSDGRRPANHAVSTQIYGHANSRYVDAVKIRFADGDSVEPALTWVSKPINAGFFFFDVPREHRVGGHEAILVQGLDANENVVTSSFSNPSDETLPPPDALLEDKSELARTQTADGDAILWSAPTRYGGSCSWLEIGGQSYAGAGCLSAGTAAEPGGSFRIIPTEHAVVVAGRFDSRFETVQFGFADQTLITAPLIQGLLLFAVPPEHLTPEAQLVQIRPRTSEGSTPIDYEIFPGTPVCETPLPTRESCA